MALPYLYLRALRQVDHTVFCVSEGQKQYYDPVFGRRLPFSSGQQVKRSMLDQMADLLGEGRASITFNWEMTDKGGKPQLAQKEPWSPCDPSSADQLIGGWMRAQSSERTIKRRSPLSISAMRPLHPLLAGVSRESLTFDRSDHPEKHEIVVRDGQGNVIPKEKVLEFLETNQRALPMRIWIPEDKVGGRATGLFVYDVAIDLRMLFSVSLNDYEPELTAATRKELIEAGWKTSADGVRLICPGARRAQIISALAHSLIFWRVSSNQARTYSPQNTLAVALSDNANKVGAAIRAELREQETDKQQADPVLDLLEGVELFTALTAKGYIPGVVAAPDALEQAEKRLVERLTAFAYE